VNAVAALFASRFGLRRTYQTDRARRLAAEGPHKIDVITQFLTDDPARTPLIGDGRLPWYSQEVHSGTIERHQQSAEARDHHAEAAVRERSAGPQEVDMERAVPAVPVGTFQEDRASVAYPTSAGNRGARRPEADGHAE
jgi:hypothetical protein